MSSFSNMKPKKNIANPHDVLLGRGQSLRPGNITYREIIAEYRSVYESAKKNKEKMRITNEIVARICSNGGRFLKDDATTGRLSEISVTSARLRVGQALRHQLRISNNDNNSCSGERGESLGGCFSNKSLSSFGDNSDRENPFPVMEKTSYPLSKSASLFSARSSDSPADRVGHSCNFDCQDVNPSESVSFKFSGLEQADADLAENSRVLMAEPIIDDDLLDEIDLVSGDCNPFESNMNKQTRTTANYGAIVSPESLKSAVFSSPSEFSNKKQHQQHCHPHYQETSSALTIENLMYSGDFVPHLGQGTSPFWPSQQHIALTTFATN